MIFARAKRLQLCAKKTLVWQRRNRPKFMVGPAGFIHIMVQNFAGARYHDSIIVHKKSGEDLAIARVALSQSKQRNDLRRGRTDVGSKLDQWSLPIRSSFDLVFDSLDDSAVA